MTSTPLPPNLENHTKAGASWDVRPFSLVTLLDMLPFLAYIFYFASRQLDEWRCDLKQNARERGKDSTLTPAEIETARGKFGMLKTQCERVKFNGILKRLSDIEVMFIGSEFHADEQVSIERMMFQLDELTKAIVRDLKPHLFMAIKPDDAGRYDQKQMFGPKVYRNFKSTRLDVTEAGNCYTLGRYTACVFHCMRVLEKGLRALVQELNNKHAAGIVFSGPVDEANWGSLIGEIQLALENPKRQKRLNPLPDKVQMAFYSKLSLEFEYFKNAWRDDVSHSRSHYDESEAKSVMNHVDAFMRQVAQRLTEQPSEADNPLPEN